MKIRKAKMRNQKCNVVEFDSVKEIFGYGLAGAVDPAKYPKTRPHHANNEPYLDAGQKDYDWVSGGQFKSLEDAKAGFDKLAISGWKDGVANLLKLKNKTKGKVPPPRDVRTWLDEGYRTGSVLDVGMFLDKNPRCWGRWDNDDVPTKTIRLLVNTTVSCAESQKDMERKGAAAMIAAELLEEAGYSVTIDAFNCARVGEGRYLAMMRAKQDDAPLNLARLAAMVGNIAVQRGGWFYAMVVQDMPVGHGYGYCEYNVSKDDLVEAGVIAASDKAVFVKQPRSDEDVIKAVKEILEQAEKCGTV